jgi:hypothetical protein
MLVFYIPEDISSMEECNVTGMGKGQNVSSPTGDFSISRSAIFQRKA